MAALKSDLVAAIRDAYLEANPDIKPGTLTSPAVDLAQFCEFAANWLADNKIIGVGYSTGPLAIRFADGRELAIVNDDSDLLSANTPAVSLAKGGTSARQGIGAADTSVPVTGK